MKMILFLKRFFKSIYQIDKQVTISPSFKTKMSSINTVNPFNTIITLFRLANFTYQYWDLGWVKRLYDELRNKESLENKVDQLWTGICTWQFPIAEEYLLFIRDRSTEHTKKSPDITAKQLQNGRPFTIILMTSRASQNSAWR